MFSPVPQRSSAEQSGTQHFQHTSTQFCARRDQSPSDFVGDDSQRRAPTPSSVIMR
jgi:hypothetical protein